MGEFYVPGPLDNISMMSLTIALSTDAGLTIRVDALEDEVYEPDPSTPNPPE